MSRGFYASGVMQPHIDNSLVRDALEKVLKTDTDFDAFCQDHCRETYNRFSTHQDRMVKTNTLLMLIDSPEIYRRLQESRWGKNLCLDPIQLKYGLEQKPTFIDNHWHITLASNNKTEIPIELDTGTSCRIFLVERVTWNTLMPRDISDKKKYIFRILKTELMGNLTEVSKSLRVALNYTALAKVDGVPNIVSYGNYQGCPWLLMEHAKGERLDNLIENKRVFSVNQIKAIAEDLCNTIAYVHSLDIAHGDLHWRDIFIDTNRFGIADIDQRNCVMILDFSAARIDDPYVPAYKDDSDGSRFRRDYLRDRLRPRARSPFEAAVSYDIQALPDIILPIICGRRKHGDERISDWIARARQEARAHSNASPVLVCCPRGLEAWAQRCLSEFNTVQQALGDFQELLISENSLEGAAVHKLPMLVGGAH